MPRRVTTLLLVALLASSPLCCEAVGAAPHARAPTIALGANVTALLNALDEAQSTGFSCHSKQRANFFREVVLNSAHALDKARWQWSASLNDAGEAPSWDIRVRINRENRTLTIRDGGVGMTKDDLENLAKGVNSSALRQVDWTRPGAHLSVDDVSLGFYSVFAVANRVWVASKHDDSDRQWVWESAGDGTYQLYEDERGNTLGRGTELMLRIKPDADQFLDEEWLRESVQNQCACAPAVIMLARDAPCGERDERNAAGAGEAWVQLSRDRPLWRRPLNETTEREYTVYYRCLTKGADEPLFYGLVQHESEASMFLALLFVQGPSTGVKTNMSSFTRGYYMTDRIAWLPTYLDFMTGVIDSDDAYWSISDSDSPALLQYHTMRIVKRQVTRIALSILADIAENDKKLNALKRSDDSAELVSVQARLGQPKQTEILYPKIWEAFGVNLRRGIIEANNATRLRLARLLRYKSSRCEDEWSSLDDYVARNPTDGSIYVTFGESLDAVKDTPRYQAAMRRNIEVMYMMDAIDRDVVAHLREYAGRPFVDIEQLEGLFQVL